MNYPSLLGISYPTPIINYELPITPTLMYELLLPLVLCLRWEKVQRALNAGCHTTRALPLTYH